MNFVSMIRKFDYARLRRFWERNLSGRQSDWPPGKALEHVVLRAFEIEGAEVRWPYSVQLGGETVEQIDGAIHVVGLTCLVECKDLAAPVNVEPLAKLRNQLLRRPSGAIGVVISRQGFTDPARTLARFIAPQSILLWEGADFDFALSRGQFVRGLQTKYRRLVEEAVPDYSLQTDYLP
jgi:hypothetical protein